MESAPRNLAEPQTCSRKRAPGLLSGKGNGATSPQAGHDPAGHLNASSEDSGNRIVRRVMNQNEGRRRHSKVSMVRFGLRSKTLNLEGRLICDKACSSG